MPDELIDLRYQASIDPEVVANPPLRRPSGPTALRTLWRMDLTRDSRLKHAADAHAGAVGSRRQGQPPERRADAAQHDAQRRLVMTSHTGHWMQWERAELFNQLVTDFLSETSVFATS